MSVLIDLHRQAGCGTDGSAFLEAAARLLQHHIQIGHRATDPGRVEPARPAIPITIDQWLRPYRFAYQPKPGHIRLLIPIGTKLRLELAAAFGLRLSSDLGYGVGYEAGNGVIERQGLDLPATDQCIRPPSSA